MIQNQIQLQDFIVPGGPGGGGPLPPDQITWAPPESLVQYNGGPTADLPTFRLVPPATVTEMLFSFAVDPNTIVSLTNVQTMTALQTLQMSSDGGGALDLSGMPWLQHIIFFQAGIDSIDLSGDTGLIELALTRCNGLTSLDISDCTGLQTMDLSQSASLAVLTGASGKTNLTSAVLVAMDALLSANFSGDTALTSLTISDGLALTSVDVSGCSALIDLFNTPNPNLPVLTNLNLSGCSSLGGFVATNIDFPSLQVVDASNCPTMNDLELAAMSSVTSVNITNFGNDADSAFIDVSETSITSLILSGAGPTGGHVGFTLVATDCALLVTVDTTGFSYAPDGAMYFNGCSLDVASVDAVLHAAAISPNIGDGTFVINLTGGLNATPSAAGIADKNLLLANGNAVFTN